VPARVTIAVGVENQAHAAHTLVVATPQQHTLRVPAGAGATMQIAGLANGSYRVFVDGVPRSRLIVGAQGGP
jgi:hypothetical protein